MSQQPGDDPVLLLPGPATPERAVLHALSAPIEPHYGADWVPRYARILALLQRVFATTADVVPLFGPGHAALEMMLASALAPGDDLLLVPVNGPFARRIVYLAQAHGIEVRTVTAPETRPYTADDVHRALDRHPRTSAIAVVHHETGVGLMNPVAEVCRLGRERDLLTFVDAVSSVGGTRLEVDGWGIDLCAGVANKCLAGPVGIAPVTVSQRAWARILDDRPKRAGWYLNLATWRWAAQAWGSWHPHPTTMPTSALIALEVALEVVLDRGLDAHAERHASAARAIRAGLRELGFEMLVEDDCASPVLTSVVRPASMNLDDYLRWLLHEHGLRVAPALEIFTGRAFRVAHMGRAADPGVVDRFLRATRRYVETRMDGRVG